MRYASSSFLVGLIALVAACGSDERSSIPDACNPLGGTTCLMPWPSSAHLIEADTVTGYRIDLSEDGMPFNIDARTVDPAPFNRWDGFGPSGVILAAFPTGVSAEGLPPHGDPAASLAADSPVILLNLGTGERVAFFAEVDMNTELPEERALIIHPLERMQPGARHLVAVRKAVKAPDGAALPVSEGFQALLDGADYPHPLWQRTTAHADKWFTALEAQGVSKDDLVLAWDFVTASNEFLQSDLLAMREQALPAIGENGASLTFQAEELSNSNARTLRLIKGTHDAPNFLTDGERDLSILRRGAGGLPEMEGMYAANFAAVIPQCVTDPETVLPVPVMVFGHGLFGDGLDSIDGGFLQGVADDYCFVFVAGDFIGLTNRQIAAAAFAANDANRASGLTEKLAQSVINFIALEQIVRGPFAADPLFQHEGTSIIDPQRVHYFGASLGGIMGNVFMAYDPHVERGVLGVPGGAWSLLIERSFAWSPLQTAVLAAYEDQYFYQINVALLGMAFEPYDPITTAHNVIADPLPGTPPKQILMYEAVGDSLVTNLSTEAVAREMGLDVCGPSLRIPFGMGEHLEPAPSALTIYTEKPTPLPLDTNVPPSDDNGTHGDINEYPAVLRQIEHFFYQGEVRQECRNGDAPAPCDCTIGACD